MTQFVDGELDTAGLGLGRPANANGIINGVTNGTRQEQGQGVDACEGSSSDKENWGHVRGGPSPGGAAGAGVGLGIQINTSTITSISANGGTNPGTDTTNNSINSLNGSASSPSAPASSSTVTPSGRKVDLGPLIGTKRGFRTREKVPFGGGVGGVEMVPSTTTSSSLGFMGPASFGAGSPVWSSSLGTTAGPSSSNWRPSMGPSRTAFNSNSTSTSGARVRTYDRKGKGRATETNEDVDVDVEGDGE
jgi:hypothetical protein